VFAVDAAEIQGQSSSVLPNAVGRGQGSLQGSSRSRVSCELAQLGEGTCRRCSRGLLCLCLSRLTSSGTDVCCAVGAAGATAVLELLGCLTALSQVCVSVPGAVAHLLLGCMLFCLNSAGPYQAVWPAAVLGQSLVLSGPVA
jgi:hypothetical protein